MSKKARISLLVILLFTTALPQNKSINIGIISDGFAPEERAPLTLYLSSQLGKPVKLVTPETYNETLARFGDGSFNFACLGAVTYVRARARYGVIPLVQRTSDRQFHSVFITGASSPIKSLHDLKGKQFAFGDINSTSGHVVPYVELKRAKIDPDKDLKFRYSGGHSLTAKLVESGVVDAGAMDESVYQSMINNGVLDPAKVRVFHTSQAFVDYVWVARKGVPDDERQRFAQALLSLKEGKDDAVLRLLRAKQFVVANDEEYAAIRRTAHELNMF
jgi:phosphonate transport system substrate-binding protein